MLSVGERDGRKGLGFGGDMVDTELEEGEAWSNQNDDSSVDPDIALAYLDEKLHSVLGHFQKDFEGGVSAENLGAKFGGYGSFLPTYQRSPVGSHPRTLKIQNHALRSPSNVQLEGGSQNITMPALGHLPADCPDRSNNGAPTSKKAFTPHDPVKLDAGMEHNRAERFTSRAETFNRSTLVDQKKLKVRIKVGSDNLSTQTKAELYSALGLHASPSSSLEDSLKSEGWSREPRDAPDESPNSILHIMISLPLEGSTLLSPLGEDLAYLTRHKKTQKQRRPDSVSNHETSKLVSLTNGAGSSQEIGKLSSSKVNGISLESSIGRTRNFHNGISNFSNVDDEASACEKLISDALRLPLLSTVDIPVTITKASEVSRGTIKDTFSSEGSKVNPSEMFLNHNDVCVDKNPTADDGSAWEDQKENHTDDTEVQPRKYLICEGGKSFEYTSTEMNLSKEVKAVKPEISNPTLKADTKVGYQKQEVRDNSVVKDLSSSRVKSKSKMTPCRNNVADLAKGKLTDGPSSQSKHKRNIYQGYLSEDENSKLQSDTIKSKDAYKDSFGDWNSEHGESEAESLEFPAETENGFKGSNVIDKISCNNVQRPKPTSKKVEKSITSESYLKNGSHAVPLVSGPSPVAPAPPAPVLIQEHWVGCDKCQKWRLLPVGKLPDSLPEKWSCSMLDWLPGMNRCDIEEEETTKALVSSYQASAAPEGDKNLHGRIGGNTTGACPDVIQHPSSKVNSVASNAKKKNGLTETTTAVYSHGPSAVRDPAKNFRPGVKSSSMNDVKQSPSLTDMNNLRRKKSSELVMEKNKKSSKEKQKLHKHSLDGGGAVDVKEIKKRGADQDSLRASKKHKNECRTDEGWLSETDYYAPSRNGGPKTSCTLPFVVTGKDRSMATEAMIRKIHTNEKSYNPKTSKKTKDRVWHSVDGLSDKRGSDSKDSSANKTKANGSHDSRESESLRTTGLKFEGRNEHVKESNQRDRCEEMKSRVLSQEIRVSSSYGERISERDNRAVLEDPKPAQDPDSFTSKHSMEDMDPSKRGVAASHPFTDATSSSSKISNSRKSKANLQVADGSPVESVSSSPLRSQSKDGHASSGRNVFNTASPPEFLGLSSSPKRCSDHEIGCSSDVIGHSKENYGRMGNASGVIHKGKEFSTVLDFRDSVPGNKTKGRLAACDEIPCNHIIYAVGNSNSFDGSLPDNESSVRSKDGMRKSDMFDSSQDLTHAHAGKLTDDKLSEHTAVKSHKLEKNNDMKISSEHGKYGAQVKPSCDDGQNAKHYIFPSLSACKQSLPKHEGASNTLPPEKIDPLETSVLRRKSVLQSPFAGGSSTDKCHTHHTPGSNNGNDIDNKSINASQQDDSLNGPKLLRKTGNQNAGQLTTSRHPTPVGQKANDLTVPSPARRDSSNQSAASAVKEAKTLKHMADRVKSSGSNVESIGLYFQAALKFLLGASLLESSTSETRQGDLIQSIQMYSSTAKLCEFCANEYEKAKDVASAALAYKCTEVAYMRVIYSSHSNANRDRHELQTALQMAPPGESPSSSASDVDNVNNAATVDKVIPTKGVSSPQVAGNHIISARNRPGFARLLNFARDVNFAMEASRKSRIALSAVNAQLEQANNEEGISSIKKALDFNFQDVEGLLQLIRLAMEAISR